MMTAVLHKEQSDSISFISFIVVTLIVFLASLFGILTRPMGFLAAIWPANAILLGLMVRNPRFANIWGWSGALTGYLAADLLTGGDLIVTFWLTLANMSGAITGYLLFQRLNEGDRLLSRPLSVLYLFAICCAASTVAAITGGGAAVIVFEQNFLSGLEFWFVTELVNSLIILPVILTLPALGNPLKQLGDHLNTPRSYWYYAPFAALIVSTGAAVGTGGPGAIAYPVPALLWCALTYRMFPVSLVTLGICGILLVSLTSDLVYSSMADDLLGSTSSMRLGIALIALGPLTAASINQARADLLTELQYTANHDGLTGTLNRHAFMDRAARLAGDMGRGTRPITVFVLDIDHFKAVNDTHGHAMGDRVLAKFASTVAATLRPDDIFARIGGEEFAIIVPGASRESAAIVGERIRVAVGACREADPEMLPSSTVSIGIALSTDFPNADFEKLLSIADEALYRAKAEGRNRVILA